MADAVVVLVFSEHATVREQKKHPGPANIVEALMGTAWCLCCDGGGGGGGGGGGSGSSGSGSGDSGSGSGGSSRCAAAAVGRRVRVSLVSPKRLVSALAKGGVHVLVLPGGSSARQSAALGTEGRAAVRAFVASGGGYVGICAGAFLAASHYEPGRSLALVRAAVVENGAAAAGQKARWLRGKAHVPVRLSATGAALLWREERPVAAVAAAGSAAAAAPGAEDEVVVGGGGGEMVAVLRYCNGPLLRRAPRETAEAAAAAASAATAMEGWWCPPAEYEELGVFDGEVARYDYVEPGSMRGACAVARATFGSGRVLLVSPHPESTPLAPSLANGPGLPRFRRLVQRAVALVAGCDVAVADSA